MFPWTGFQVETFVESTLADDTTSQRQRDVPFSKRQNVLEREMLPAYSGAWIDVTGKAIKDFLKSRGFTVNRQTISQLKLRLLESHQGDMLESYQKLENYLSQAADNDTFSCFGFENSDSGVFQRACFFPGACLLAKRHYKHVIGLDDTHLKGDMNKRGIFLLTTTKDYNNHILVFGLTLVELEDTSNWRWFLQHMKVAVASASSNWDPAFVNDRQKGILAAVTELYPNRGHRFCVRHIIGNVEKMSSRLSPQEQALIFAMARSDCESDYNYYRSLLSDTRPVAATYLDGIKKEHWVTYAINQEYNQPSYDEVTSNLSEAANHWLGNDCRSSYPLHAFEQYMLKVVERFAERRCEAVRGKKSASGSTPTHSGIPTKARFYAFSRQ